MKTCAWCGDYLEGRQKNGEFCNLDCYRHFIRNGPDKIRVLTEEKKILKEEGENWRKKYWKQDSRGWALKKLLGLV